jgi:hypothetical protein
MPTAETVLTVTATEPRSDLSGQWLLLARTGQQTAIETVRRLVDTVDHAVHLPADLVRHAVSSIVIVDVDVGVDVDVASRATRAIEEAQPASARG